jgi:hypothetical protein
VRFRCAQAASPFDTSDFKASNAIITIMIDFYEPIFSVPVPSRPSRTHSHDLTFVCVRVVCPSPYPTHRRRRHHQQIEQEREAKEKQRTASQ